MTTRPVDYPPPPVPGAHPPAAALVEALDEPCLLTAPDGTIRTSNAAAREVLALPASAQGTPLRRLLEQRGIAGDACVDELLAQLAEVLGETLVPMRLRVADTYLSLTWKIVPLMTDDGPGERSGAQGQSPCPTLGGRPFLLHRLYPHQPEDTDAQRIQFLANVGHELRTPLSALVATTELMLQDHQTLAPDELGHMMGFLHRNTRRLESHVSNLLDAASLQNGRFHLRRSSTQVQTLVRDAVDFVLPLLQVKNQKLETRTFGQPPVLIVDPKRIVGVLVNLLSNASRYGLPNEPIQLLIACEDTLVRFTVRQKGPGIPQHEQALLFQRFYRASAAETQAGGSGLGLAIVKDIVEMHGGTVGLVSKPNKTTAFWFTIPVEQVASSAR